MKKEYQRTMNLQFTFSLLKTREHQEEPEAIYLNSPLTMKLLDKKRGSVK